MANRFPLIVDSSGVAALKELPSGDNLDLTGNGIVGAGTVALTNLTVGGSQGTDGQVLTSTGSGIAWEDAASGGGGGGAWNVISHTSVTSAVAQLEWTLSGYTDYALVFRDTQPSSGYNFNRISFSTNGGTSYSSNVNQTMISTGNNWSGIAQLSRGNTGSTSPRDYFAAELSHESNFITENQITNGVFYIYNNVSGNTKTGRADIMTFDGRYGVNNVLSGFSINESAVINKIKWVMTGNGTTNIAAGTFTLYGLSTS